MLLTTDEIEKLQLKIDAMESLTSGEIKIIIAKNAVFGLKTKAKKLFKKHNLDKTTNRNGVLFLILENDRKLLIYGDQQVTDRVGNAYWETIISYVTHEFRNGNFASGISLGVHMIAEVLINHFPSTEHNTNEISNEIIFEK